ncbi:MAG: hypothetical protein JW384_00395 [Nitrosomonadaceae bacterium]|nr:hypothetical protein [Nitrosomonadaceae bacterium]
MSESPEIATERLSIVSFSEHFLTPQYVHWLNDPDVVRFSMQRHQTHTLETCREYWLSFAGTPHYFWAIVEKEQGLGHIGNINAYINVHDRVADIGILLSGKSVAGRGYGREAWRAVCDYLFKQAEIRKITAGTCTANKPMLALMKATGMAADGRRIRQTIVDGQEMDIVHAALFSDSWVR